MAVLIQKEGVFRLVDKERVQEYREWGYRPVAQPMETEPPKRVEPKSAKINGRPPSSAKGEE